MQNRLRETVTGNGGVMAFGRIKRHLVFSIINKWCIGLNERNCKIKNIVLSMYGYPIGTGTRIVGPVDIDGKLSIGNDSFIGKYFSVYGNGSVNIGNKCDLAPNVTFLTGTHEIGDSTRRAGKGANLQTIVGDGTWIGAKTTILPGITIGTGCVIAAGSVVTENVPDNTLVAGVPATIKRKLGF